MLDLSKTYRTRDGSQRNIRLSHDPEQQALCRLERLGAGPSTPSSWAEDGRFSTEPCHKFDLLPEDDPTLVDPKPFDYDACPIIDGKRMAETLDGRKVVLLCNDAPGNEPIRGYYCEDGGSLLRSADGTCRSVPSLNLRVPPKPKRTVWVNLHQGRLQGFNDAAWYDSEREANRAAPILSTRLGNRAYPIEIEEDA